MFYLFWRDTLFPFLPFQFTASDKKKDLSHWGKNNKRIDYMTENCNLRLKILEKSKD